MDTVVIVVAYAVGAVPFALLLTRHLRGTDVRQAGSGNLGAANVLRTSGTSAAVKVMVLDVSKGSVAVLLARTLGAGDPVEAAAAAAAVTGHVYPVWLGFRGGKGVATACGAFAVLSPLSTMVAAGVFVGTVWFTKYVSLGSIAASLTLAPLAYLFGATPPVVVAAAGVTALVLHRHRSNMARLQAGTERQVHERTATDASDLD